MKTDEECVDGTIQLVEGITNSTGRLEICARGRWGGVYNAENQWSMENSKVACRQLGFSYRGQLKQIFTNYDVNALNYCIVFRSTSSGQQ